jgi:uncharacterized protein YdcH (DUF465 family)
MTIFQEYFKNINTLKGLEQKEEEAINQYQSLISQLKGTVKNELLERIAKAEEWHNTISAQVMGLQERQDTLTDEIAKFFDAHPEATEVYLPLGNNGVNISYNDGVVLIVSVA